MGKPQVVCICVSWKQDPSRIIKNMLNQTYKNKHLLVVCSEVNIKPLKKKFPQCEFLDVPTRGDWGHSARAAGMALVTDKSKYMCFCNSDDEYDLNYLKMMVGALEAEKADFVYCCWRDKTLNGGVAEPGLKMGGLTNGTFVVKSSIALKVGWKHRQYAADWYFVREMLREGMQIVYMPYCLLKHN